MVSDSSLVRMIIRIGVRIVHKQNQMIKPTNKRFFKVVSLPSKVTNNTVMFAFLLSPGPSPLVCETLS